MTKLFLVEAETEADYILRRGNFYPRGEVVTCGECKYRMTAECWANRLFTCDSDYCSRGVKKDEE